MPRTDWRVLAVGGLAVRNKVQGLGSHQQKRQTPPAFAGGASWATYLASGVRTNRSRFTAHPQQLQKKTIRPATAL